MAYAQAGEARLNYYSSPTVSYKGRPTGSQENNNARALTEVSLCHVAPPLHRHADQVRGGRAGGRERGVRDRGSGTVMLKDLKTRPPG